MKKKRNTTCVNTVHRSNTNSTNVNDIQASSTDFNAVHTPSVSVTCVHPAHLSGASITDADAAHTSGASITDAEVPITSVTHVNGVRGSDASSMNFDTVLTPDRSAAHVLLSDTSSAHLISEITSTGTTHSSSTDNSGHSNSFYSIQESHLPHSNSLCAIQDDRLPSVATDFNLESPVRPVAPLDSLQPISSILCSTPKPSTTNCSARTDIPMTSLLSHPATPLVFSSSFPYSMNSLAEQTAQHTSQPSNAVISKQSSDSSDTDSDSSLTSENFFLHSRPKRRRVGETKNVSRSHSLLSRRVSSSFRPSTGAPASTMCDYAPVPVQNAAVKGESFCDCPREGRDLDCVCGEEETELEWVWDHETKSSACRLAPDCRSVKFHIDYSSGTASIRGNQPMTNHQYFWEIKMITPVYGTDMMVGVGSSHLQMDAYKHVFCSLLGRDADSWGLSYLGRLHHKGITRQYSSKFGQGTIIGVHLDMWHGYLSFYKNRRPLGLAYRGLQGKVLHPMITSTSARTGMKVIRSTSFPTSLQFMSCQVLRRIIPADISVLDALPLPPGLRNFLANNLRWLLRPRELKDGDVAATHASTADSSRKRPYAMTSTGAAGQLSVDWSHRDRLNQSI